MQPIESPIQKMFYVPKAKFSSKAQFGCSQNLANLFNTALYKVYESPESMPPQQQKKGNIKQRKRTSVLSIEVGDILKTKFQNKSISMKNLQIQNEVQQSESGKDSLYNSPSKKSIMLQRDNSKQADAQKTKESSSKRCKTYEFIRPEINNQGKLGIQVPSKYKLYPRNQSFKIEGLRQKLPQIKKKKKTIKEDMRDIEKYRSEQATYHNDKELPNMSAIISPISPTISSKRDSKVKLRFKKAVSNRITDQKNRVIVVPQILPKKLRYQNQRRLSSRKVVKPEINLNLKGSLKIERRFLTKILSTKNHDNQNAKNKKYSIFSKHRKSQACIKKQQPQTSTFKPWDVSHQFQSTSYKLFPPSTK